MLNESLHSEATDIENSCLVDNLSWTTNPFTTYAQFCPHMDVDQSHDKVIFHITELTKCSKQTKPASCLQTYLEDEVLCLVKFIYAYLAQGSEIV